MANLSAIFFSRLKGEQGWLVLAPWHDLVLMRREQGMLRDLKDTSTA
jgi:hypothetical protein